MLFAAKISVLLSITFVCVRAEQKEDDSKASIRFFEPEDQNPGKSAAMPEVLHATKVFKGKEVKVILFLAPNILSHDLDEEYPDFQNHGVYSMKDSKSDHQIYVVERLGDGKFILLHGYFTDGGTAYSFLSDIHESKDGLRKRKRDVFQTPNSQFAEMSDQDLPMPTNLTEFFQDSGINVSQIEAQQQEARRENGDIQRDYGYGFSDPHKPIPHVLETCLYIDYSVYRRWVYFVGVEKALPRIILWYSFLWEIVRISFKSLRFRHIKLKVTVNYFKIISTFRKAIIKFDNINAYRSLKKFILATAFRPGFVKCDHNQLITTFSFPPANGGIAFLSGACSIYSVSIVRDFCQPVTAQIMAHEIAHSLGATHDGENGCSPLDNYIMTPSIRLIFQKEDEERRWQFSTCSSNQIEYFLKYYKNSYCTLPPYTTLGPVFPKSEKTPPRLGRQIDKNEQCRISVKHQLSFWCSSVQEVYDVKLHSNVCLGMWCAISNAPHQCARTAIALEYTPCDPADDSKVCRLGRCVRDCQWLIKKCKCLKGHKKEHCFKKLARCTKSSW